jgi:8-oxo-dGTP pyrophosphatase MutT (NUDIX family)
MARSRQVAALPVRCRAPHAPAVLLITSRETRRWVIPKGWPMPGRTDAEAAACEAYEEAGLRGRIDPEPVGHYTYLKRLARRSVPVSVDVYLMHVDDQAGNWPEAAERHRRWLAPQAAAALVQEPELSALLSAAGSGCDADCDCTDIQARLR